MDIDLVNDFVSKWLEDDYFENLLEKFDLTPEEVFILLFKQGLIDENKIEELRIL